MLLVLFLLVLDAERTGSGSIRGQVRDERCQDKPNVFVRATRSGASTGHGVTDSNGYYSVTVPVGRNTVTYEAPGYTTEVREIHVPARDFASQDVQLRPRGTTAPVIDCEALEETITVVAAEPIVNTDAPTSTVTVSDQQTGADAPTAGAVVVNQVLIDGIVLNPRSAIPPASATNHIEHVTGAQPAGASGPTIINMRQQAGTNDFAGRAQFSISPRAWQADPSAVANPQRERGAREARRLDAAIGGPIIRDRFFFFTSYEQENETITHPSSDLMGPTTGDHDALSLSVNLRLQPVAPLLSTLQAWTRAEGWSGTLGDFYGRINGSPEATIREADDRTTSIITSHAYATSTTYLTVYGSYLGQTLRENGQEGFQTRETDRRLFASGGSGYLADEWRRTRWNAGLNAHATVRAWGEHAITAGASHEAADDSLRDHLTGGQLVEVGAGTLLSRFVTGAPARKAQATLASVFVNDAWQWKPFRVNLGVRWDGERVKGGAELSTQLLQPRLALIWSPTDRAHGYATWSRYAQPLTPDHRFSLLTEREHRTRTVGTDREYRGLHTVERNPKMSANDEITLGGSIQVAQTALEGRYTRRRQHAFLEDLLCTDGRERCIGNPSAGALADLLTLRGELVPTPAPRHDQDLLDLRLTTRWPRWRGMISYLWTREHGNLTGGGAQHPTDGFATPAYDFLEFLQPLGGPAYGPLPTERRHRLNLSASADAGRIRYALDAYFATGLPRSRYGFSDLYGDHLILLAPRGIDGRSPGIYEAHAGAEYELRLGDIHVTIVLAARNLLNGQRPITLDERWSFREGDNDNVVSPNPTFGAPLSRTDPRQILLGAKLSF